MRFIRDIINEKTQAARKGATSALRYSDQPSAQHGMEITDHSDDGTQDTPKAAAVVQSNGGFDIPLAADPSHPDPVEPAAIGGAHELQQPAPSHAPAHHTPIGAQPIQEPEARAATDPRLFGRSSTGRPTDPVNIAAPEAPATLNRQTDWDTSEAMRDVAEAAGDPRAAPAGFEAAMADQIVQPEMELPPIQREAIFASPARFDGPKHTIASQSNAEVQSQPFVLQPEPSAIKTAQAPLDSQVAQATRPDEEMAPLSAPVSAHKPTNGRGSKGRVKTRLLGFSAPQSPVHDPMSQSREAAPAIHAQFPVGWLVVVDGPGKGASYSLFDGLTQIGRGEDQTVRLNFGDTTISRQNHAAIAFDGEERRFFFGHGGKANLVRLNGRPVLSTEVLEPNSVIRIGETTLRFVALCGDAFSWDGADVAETGRASLG